MGGVVVADFVPPSAQVSTIFARIARYWAVFARRAHRTSCARSASVSTSSAFGRPTGAAFDACPSLATSSMCAGGQVAAGHADTPKALMIKRFESNTPKNHAKCGACHSQEANGKLSGYGHEAKQLADWFDTFQSHTGNCLSIPSESE